MSDRNDDGPDLTRRKFLTRIGLAGATAYTAPALTHLGMAHASGGGSGGGGSGGGGGGAGGSGGSGGSGRFLRRRTVRRTRRRVVQRTPPPPPELILFLPVGTGADPVREAGYTVRAETANTTLGGTLYRLGLPPGVSPEDGTAQLAALLPGATVDENHIYTADEFLCDDDGCAAHEMIGWSGWPSIYAPRIGMVDTGINQDHPALAGQNLIVHQADLGERAEAGRKHGTAIAAMLVGRLDYRVPGLLPNATLVAVEAFHQGYYGEQADVFSLASAVDILGAADVNVINMSFSGPRNAILGQLVQRMAEQDIAVVAAAGNEGPGADPVYPAAFERVLAVTAIDRNERAYRQANQGGYINFAAPGVRIWAAASVSGGRLKSGTSYAAPFVTATLAVQRLRAPGVPLEQIVGEMNRCAKDLGDVGHDPVFGHGLVAAPGQCFADDPQLFPVAGE